MGFLLLSGAAFLTLLVVTSGSPRAVCQPCRLALLALSAIGCAAALSGLSLLIGALAS